MNDKNFTRAEVIACAISDLFKTDKEILASPIGILPNIGVRLARLSHSPQLLLSDGEATLFADTPAVGEPFQEPEGYLPYRMLFELMQNGKRHVMMGAAQIDRFGNQNLSAIGDRDKPKKQLLGARAAATNTVTHRVSYWVAKHEPRVFVPHVDIITGVGKPKTSGAKKYHNLGQVITNLGVFDFSGPEGEMNIVSLHPVVSLAEVHAQTGFALHGGANAGVTREPTAEELWLIRNRIDPKNLRDKEIPDTEKSAN